MTPGGVGSERKPLYAGPETSADGWRPDGLAFHMAFRAVGQPERSRAGDGGDGQGVPGPDFGRLWPCGPRN